MTVIADNKRRVVLSEAKPGDRFDICIPAKGKYILTKLSPASDPLPARVRIQKRGKYHVGILSRPINESVLRNVVAEFP